MGWGLTTSEINEETDISSSAVKSTRKILLHGFRRRGRDRIKVRGGRIALNSIRPLQSPMGADICTSDTHNINKDTDLFTSYTDNNSEDLSDNEARRQSQKKRKRRVPKKES